MSALILPIALSLLVLLSAPTAADAANVTVDDEFKGFEESLVLEFDNPTDLAFSSDFKVLLVSEKSGKLWVVENFDEGDGVAPTKTEALDISTRMCTNGERGLGGVTFHPRYPEKPYVYLYYTYNKYNDCYNNLVQDSGRGTVNRLSRYVLSPSKIIDVYSEMVLLETPKQPVHNHNGGGIAFGNDGLLYVPIGDGGTRSWKNDDGVYYPQALNVLFGKIARVTEDGDIPEDNPYTPSQGHPDSVRCGQMEGEAYNATTKCQEIYSSGLRNPWRLAMDYDYTEGVRFYINDVGRQTWERIVEGKLGHNYGYPEQDGPCKNTRWDTSCEPNEFSALDVHWYLHDDEDGGCVTGGAFVPDNIGWPASFQGAYLYAEYAQSGIFRITPGGEGCPYPRCDPPISDYAPTKKTLSTAQKVVSMHFGPYRNGFALYYMSRGVTGNRGIEGLFRVAYSGFIDANRPPTAIIDADVVIGFRPLTVQFDGAGSMDPDGDVLSYEWDLDADGVTDSTSQNTSYEFTQPGIYYSSLTVKDEKGGQDTIEIRIEVDNTPPVPLIESPVEGTSFAVGDRFMLKGSAVDGEDGALLDTSLLWEVRQRHKDHYHPLLDPTEGNNIQLDGVPEPEDFESARNTVLEILLTATDSYDLSSTVTVTLQPMIVEVVIDSDPSGLELIVYGNTYRTPATIMTWAKHKFQIQAPTQTIDGTTYSWTSWSDGGCRVHDYVVPSSKPPLIMANYEIVASDAELPETETSELEMHKSHCASMVSGPELDPLSEKVDPLSEKEGMNTGAKIFLSIFFPFVAVAAVSVLVFRRWKTRSINKEASASAMAIHSKGTNATDTSV